MDLMAILEDSTNYPDTMEITIAGEKKVLSELRNAPSFKGFTKYSQERSKEKQELETKLQREMSEREKLAGDLQVALARGTQQYQIPNQTGNDPMAVFRSDPTFGPLAEALEKSNKQVEELGKSLQQLQQVQYVNAYNRALDQIQSRDDDFRKPEKVQELFDYCKKNNISNLDLGYREITRDRDIKKAEEAAVKRGIEEGKKKALTEFSMVPSGSRRMITPSPEAAKSFDEAEDAALRDPEILATFNGSE